jgi:hypothetical protein
MSSLNQLFYTLTLACLHNDKELTTNTKFSTRGEVGYVRKFKSSGLLRSVDLQTATDLSEHCHYIIFGGQ